MSYLNGKSLVLFLAVLFAVGLVFASCAPEEAEPVDPEEPEEPDEPQIVRVSKLSSPDSIIATLTKGTWEGEFAMQLFTPLLEVGPDFQPIPGVAESWEWDEETLTYTFHLRDDVYFHDGERLTAEDVAWTYQYVMDPDYPGTRFPMVRSILGAEEYRDGEADEVPGLIVEDPETLKIRLAAPDATLLLDLAGTSLGILPKHYYEPYVEEHGVGELLGSEDELPPIGAGPFQFKEWEPDEWVVYEKFEDYYLQEPEQTGQRGVPSMDEVRYIFGPDIDAQFSRLRADDLDYLSGVELTTFEAAQDDPDIRAFTMPQHGYQIVLFNQREDAPFQHFRDRKIRWSIAHAIDYESMIDAILGELGARAVAHTFPGRWDYSEEYYDMNPHYDPEQTIELMEEAGWTIEKDDDGNIVPGSVWTKNGEEFSFTLASTDSAYYQDLQEWIQTDLLEMGFDVDLRVMDASTYYFDYLADKDWEAGVGGWGLGMDPGNTVSNLYGTMGTRELGGWNWQHYVPEDCEDGVPGEEPGLIDQLDTKGVQIMDDFEKRQEIYREINEILIRDQQVIFLAHKDYTYCVDKNLQGLHRDWGNGPEYHMWAWHWDK